MKSKNKERRVINIDKKDFDIIKKYCDSKAYNMSKWIPLVLKNIISDDNKGYTHTAIPEQEN